MANFWDDLARNLFGGGQSAPKKKSTGGLKRGTPNPRPSNPRPSTTASAPQAREQRNPMTFSSVLSGGGGGGGGRGGFAAMSRGNQAPVEKKEPEVPKMTPWDAFIFGQNDEGQKRYQDNFKATGQGAPDILGEFGNFLAGEAKKSEQNRKEDAQRRQEASDALGQPVESWELNSPVVQEVVGEKRQTDARADLANAFGSRGEVTVRELTPDEWSALTPEQQKGVLSSWALYQASLEDQALADTAPEREEGYDDLVTSMFSEQGGSDIYAPNTVRVLQEIGYQNEAADLDNFIDQSALPTYEDILGQTTGQGAEARKDVYSSLANSAAFDNETITTALDKGQNLLDAIRVSGAVSDEFKTFSGVQTDYGDLGEEDFNNLNTLLNNLSNREVFARIGSDPELNQRLTDSINEANSIYGPEVVSQYFMDSVRTFDNFTDYMSPDEFAQNWLEG